MSNWKHIATEIIEVPIRSSGNQVCNTPVTFEVYQDGLLFRAVPLCSEEEMRIAGLEDEVQFSFQGPKAVALGGIKDGNQHIVEAVGALLKAKA